MKRRNTNLAKRVTATIMAAAMVMGLVACGSAESSQEIGSDTSSQTANSTEAGESNVESSPITKDVTIIFV